jgi:hypothetical protein
MLQPPQWHGRQDNLLVLFAGSLGEVTAKLIVAVAKLINVYFKEISPGVESAVLK